MTPHPPPSRAHGGVIDMKPELEDTLAQATAWCKGYAAGQEQMRRAAANLMQQKYIETDDTDVAAVYWIATGLICELPIEPIRYDGVTT